MIISRSSPTTKRTPRTRSWSWDRSEENLESFFSADELLWTLISTTAWNGTLVMNVGPTADGLLPPIFLERLASVGQWLKVNGEAIYGSRPWPGAFPSGMEGGTGPTFAGSANSTYYTIGGVNSCQRGAIGGGCATSSEGAVFAIMMTYPSLDASGKCEVTLTKVSGTPGKLDVELLGMPPGSPKLVWRPATAKGDGVTVTLPARPPAGTSTAWVLKFTTPK
jgi:hypothetical protein